MSLWSILHVYVCVYVDVYACEDITLGLPSDYIFQQDNVPKHTTKSIFIAVSISYDDNHYTTGISYTAKSTKKWLSKNNVNVLQWPCQSLDLNPIGNLRRFLKIQIWKRAPGNTNNLKTICQEEKYKIPTNNCFNSLIIKAFFYFHVLKWRFKYILHTEFLILIHKEKKKITWLVISGQSNQSPKTNEILITWIRRKDFRLK